MKWFAKEYPKEGKERIKIKFAWLPINCRGETRWLEKVKIKQKYVALRVIGGVFSYGGCSGDYWKNVEFLED